MGRGWERGRGRCERCDGGPGPFLGPMAEKEDYAAYSSYMTLDTQRAELEVQL
jgi:hypothetical protein